MKQLPRISAFVVACLGAAACQGDASEDALDPASGEMVGRNGEGTGAGGDPSGAAGARAGTLKRPPIAAPTPQNSLNTVDPSVVIPGASALVPEGVAELDEIPDTLDLSEMAVRYLLGISRTLLPENPYFHVPPGQIDMHGTPTFIFKGGAPNWGKTIQAMVMARRMSGFDLGDTEGTLTAQLTSMRNMIDVNVNRNLIARGEGAWNVITGANPENQMTTAVEALIELYRQNPMPDLGQLIQQMIAYHTTIAVKDRNDDGEPTLHYRLPEPGVTPYVPNSIGTLGYGDWPFHVGKTMRALGTWSILTGDAQALDSTNLLSAFVRNYSNGVFWSVPPGFPEGTGVGHFAGHVHMFANGLMGLLWEAEARLRVNPADPAAAARIDFVRSSYFYIRNMHGGGTAALGNFGEICAVADMLRLAVKLTELGAGDFNEDIDRWMRNQIAESQIRGAITIESHPEDPLRDNVGQKVIGLFFEDATHALAIPDARNDQGSLTLQLVACGLGNVIHGIYDVWEHIVQFKGDVAQVNLLLNKPTWWFDVKSEIPFRGVAHVTTRADLGPVSSIELRVPEGVAMGSVEVLANDVPVAFQVVRASYVKVVGVRPSTRYTVKFPLPVRTMTIRQLRSDRQNWAESSYSPDPGTGQDYGFHENDPENTFVGKLRGNTLVGVDHRPSGGIALYRGAERARWASLGDGDAPPASTHTSGRFRLKPN